jgi:DNA-directed RNA polymerase subunit L
MSMEVKVIKDENGVLDVEFDNLTIAEVLRAYLVNQNVKVAAWKRANPHSNPVLHIEADKPKDALKKAIAQIEGEVDSMVNDFKSLK